MINEYENLLRSIILDFLGNDTLKYKISPDRVLKWEEKKTEEIKKNNGLCSEPRLIYYSDFYDLETIISKNWETFKILFDDKKRFDIFFKEISAYRNTIAHGRSLLKSQLLLLEGILLDQKNLRTIYHNKNQMIDDYFIRINKVSDNLGNVWMNNTSGNRPILRVGDDYEILIEAHDPKDREIEYEIKNLSKSFVKTQKENRFNFTVGNSLIGANQSLLVEARTPNSEYQNKKHITIILTVLPDSADL